MKTFTLISPYKSLHGFKWWVSRSLLFYALCVPAFISISSGTLPAIPSEPSPEYEPASDTNFFPGEKAHPFTVRLTKGEQPSSGYTVTGTTTPMKTPTETPIPTPSILTEKRWQLSCDRNANGLPDFGDEVTFTVTFQNYGLPRYGVYYRDYLSTGLELIQNSEVVQAPLDPFGRPRGLVSEDPLGISLNTVGSGETVTISFTTTILTLQPPLLLLDGYPGDLDSSLRVSTGWDFHRDTASPEVPDQDIDLGYDLVQARVHYAAAADLLMVQLYPRGVPGDGDGDGDPSTVDPANCPVTSCVDCDRICNEEFYSVKIKFPGEADYSITFGIKDNSFTSWSRSGNPVDGDYAVAFEAGGIVEFLINDFSTIIAGADLSQFELVLQAGDLADFHLEDEIALEYRDECRLQNQGFFEGVNFRRILTDGNVVTAGQEVTNVPLNPEACIPAPTPTP